MPLFRYKNIVKRFRSFYEHYQERLFAYLLKMTGDYHLSADLMQESFTRYLERYKNRPHSGSLLFAIGRNLVIDHARRRNTRASYENGKNRCHVDQEQILMVREQYRQVLAALQKLPQKERDTLALAVSSDLPYSKIAEITGISEANVKVKIHRARVKLRRILQAGEP